MKSGSSRNKQLKAINAGHRSVEPNLIVKCWKTTFAAHIVKNMTQQSNWSNDLKRALYSKP